MQRRSNLFWGGILVLLALLLLFSQFGWIEGSIFDFFWPLVIIAIGIWLIIGFFMRGKSGEGEKVSIPLQGAASANIKFNHAAGKLTVGGGALATELLHGTFCSGLNYKTDLENDRLNVKLQTSSQFWSRWPGESLDWTVQLNKDIPLNLKVDSGASATFMDLNDLKVTALDIDTGASSTEVTLPSAAGMTRVDIDTGASTMKIHVPEGVAARISVKSGISATNVAARFPRQESGVYLSSDYETAANRAEIFINSGVGAIDIS
jgi:hypothetical protein